MKNQQVETFLRIGAFVVLLLLVVGFVMPSVESLIVLEIDKNAADGNPVIINGTLYGSEYLAEAFNQSFFFQSRPSATDYNFSYSGVNNYTVDNANFTNQTEMYLQEFMSQNPGVNVTQIPYTIITFSGSGVDPDIPYSVALIELPRVAAALFTLMNDHTYEYYNSTLQNLVTQNEAQNFFYFGSLIDNVIQVDFSILQIIEQKYGSSFIA